MMKRKIYRTLLEWKGREHKSLIVSGQRRVGRTATIEVFAKAEYEHYVYIDFSKSPELKNLFKGDADASELIKRLTMQFGEDSIVDGSTLLFLDDIQECDDAYRSLESFSEYGKIDVIASYSLLEVSVPQTKDPKVQPMSVDSVETIRMYALDFEEFLWAKGVSEDDIEKVREDIRLRRPMDDTSYDRFTDLFKEFMVVGGMPEAVEAYVGTDDFRPVNRILGDMVASCIRDMNRYNRGIDVIRAVECFDSIPYQLAEPNKKFMFSRISGKRSRRASDTYMEDLLWIKDAGYGNFCHGLKEPTVPLRRSIKEDSFKVYLSDTGMLLNMYGDKAKAAIYGGDLSHNMGAVVENMVAECLMKEGLTPMFYRKDKGKGRMELDFVLESDDGIVAMEVDSGKDRALPSLSNADRYFDISRKIVLGPSNIHVDDDVEHYPLFAVAFVKEMGIVPRS